MIARGKAPYKGVQMIAPDSGPTMFERRLNHGVIVALTEQPLTLAAIRRLVADMVDAQTVWLVEAERLNAWLDLLLRWMKEWRIVRVDRRRRWVWVGMDSKRGDPPDMRMPRLPAILRAETAQQTEVK
jgi:hypothetical protein